MFNNNNKIKDIYEGSGNKYVLYIEFEESLINQNEVISEENMQELSRLIINFDKYYFSNPKIKSCLNILFHFFIDNILMTNHLQLNIQKHFSFKFEIGIINKQKKFFFENLIYLKRNNNSVSQIKIKYLI